MRVFKSKILHVAIFMLLAFIPLSIFVDPLKLYIFIGAILFTTSVSVVVTYWPAMRLAAIQSFDELDHVDLLTMGIILIFISTGMREVYVTFYREFLATPIPMEKLNGYYVPLAFARYLAVVAGYMALAACHHSPTLKFPGWPRAILSLILGAVIGVALIKFRHYLPR